MQKFLSFHTPWLCIAVAQSLSHVRLFETLGTAACQAFLSSTISWSLLKLMSTELMALSRHLILCRPLLLLPSVFPSIMVFSSESALGIRWTKYQNFSFSISLSNEYSGLISFRIDWFDLLESSPAPQFESINSSALYLFCGPALTCVCDCWKNYSFDYRNLCWQSDVSSFYYTVYVCQSFSPKEQRVK